MGHPSPAKVQTIAPLWHTAAVLMIILGISTLGAYRLTWLRGTISTKEVRYLVSVAMEWLLLAFIAWGVHKRGVRLRDLVRGRWEGIGSVLRDMGIAVVFLVSWFMILVLLTLIIRPGHSAGVEALLPHTGRELLVFMLVSATAGVVEEIMFRGYLQQQFEALLKNSWAAGILQAVVFGAAHGYQGGRHMVIIGIFGVLFTVLAKMCNSLRPGMFAHAANDALGGIAGMFIKHAH